MSQTVLVIGGTGAQGSAVVKALVQDPKFQVKLLTRDLSSPEAEKLVSFSSQISLIQGYCFDEETLAREFAGIDSCFVNIQGFATGEKAEIYWGIRMYEVALWSGVKHFVWGGIDYCSKKAGFDPKYRCHHYDAKGKVQDYLMAQPTTPMNWSILCSGPYMEGLSEHFNPRLIDNIHTFQLPLSTGAMPLIHLDDLGLYALWIFTHPTESRGLNLEIATAHVTGADMAAAFTATTGHPARYQAANFDAYLPRAFENLPKGADTLIGESFAPGDTSLMTYGRNFTAWWQIFQASGGNRGIIQRDYELLDRILPGRIRSVEEWMKKVKYTGEYIPTLKTAERKTQQGENQG